MSQDPQSDSVHWTPARERLLLLTLAVIQFTAIVDFLIILPLGPRYMEVFKINPQQFDSIVSAYAVSAGICGIVAAFFLDRFDRKPALIGLYFGFALGTLFCALAPTYHLLVLARVVAGAFGGVVGAVILAIVGDVIPAARRGAAMGMVMSSFSVASIIGVPLGLYVAEHTSWQVPFYAIAGLSSLILVVAAYLTPSLRGHLQHASDEHPLKRTWAVLMHPDHQMAFIFMAALTFAGFMVFPNMPNYMVFNAGLTEKQLPLIYLAGGACTLFSMNWVGRWADRAGKRRVFTLISLSTAVPLLLITNLPRVPLAAALGTSTLLFICMSARMVPAMAMMTGAVEARYRGGFMSINSSVQQFSAGVATYISGYILGQSAGGQITHFPVIGVLSVACAYCCIYLARFLKPAPESDPSSVPILIETM